MNHPGKLEELYGELAKRIHAKDDEGVRRVFRELLDTGRSRQEIVSEIVRLIEAKPLNGGENFDNGTGARRAFEPSQTEWRQKPSIWAGRPATSGAGQQGFGFGAEKIPPSREPTQPESAPAQRASDTSGTPLTRAAESRSKEIDQAELGSSPKNGGRHGVEVDEINCSPNTSGGLAAAQTAGVSVEAERLIPKLEGEDAVGREIASGSSEERRDTFMGNTPPRQASVNSETAQLTAPERLAARLQLQQVPTRSSTAKQKQTAQEQADASSKDWSGVPQRGRRASSRALRVLTGASILATAAGGFYVGWSLYGSKLVEVSLGGAHSAVAWFQHLRSKDVSFSLEATTTAQKTVLPKEAVAVHDTGDQVANLRQETGEASPVRLSAEAASVVTPSSGVAGGRNPDAEPPRSDTSTEVKPTQRAAELPNNTPPRTKVPPIPPSTEQPVSSGTPMPSVQANKTDAGQSSTASAATPDATAVLLARGDYLLGASDIASARLFYERAAEAGDGRGALRMGMTFDMDFLARSGLRRVQGDPDQAIFWYRRASALGNFKAEALEKEIQDVAQQMQSIQGTASQAAEPRRVAAPHRHEPTDGPHRARSKRAP